MRARTWVSALLLTLAVSNRADAVAPRGTDHREIEAASSAKVAAPLREVVKVVGNVPPSRLHAWDAFVATAGSRWAASWDAATGVPSQVYGGSVRVPGSSANADLAELAARAFLVLHRDLFTPGVDPADLQVVSNEDDGRIRSVGFVQHHQGVRVLGGQVSVQFLNDRIYLVSSQILPDIDLPIANAGPSLPIATLVDRARAGTIAELGLTRAWSRSLAADAVIVPFVSDDAVLGYRLGVPVEVDGGVDGAWNVYVDPTTGEPLLRRATRAYASSGTLVYDTPIRWPGGGRADYAAAGAQIRVNSVDTTTNDAGGVSWTTDVAGTLVTSVIGTVVAVENTNDETADEATRTLTISPSGTARWTDPGDEAVDAQLTAFVHTQLAKDYARTLSSDSEYRGWLGEQMRATVNLEQTCNAFYNPGDASINFFNSDANCENTGRLPDVIYHEVGHGVHDHLVIEGVGGFPSDLQEGAADFFAAMITDDPGMGVGFFGDGTPLRHLDPVDDEAVYPTDVGEVHTTGLIFGGAFWDLRKLAIATLGETEGLAFTEKIFVAAMQRAPYTAALLIVALAADDDDGDIGNGTPHECLIREAFGHHGLRSVTTAVSVPDVVAGTGGETTADVAFTVGGLSLACQGDEIDHVDVSWNPRQDSTTPVSGTVTLAPQPADTWIGTIPLPDAGDVMEFNFTIVFFDGSRTSIPDNRGDPYYQLYRGELVELYCTDFETDPFAGDQRWTREGSPQDPWQWGAPSGLGGDPAEAYSGTNVVGMTIDDPGLYAPNLTARLHSPVVDVGQYSDVRLQYRRWLGVEEGFFDKAKVYANDQQIWQNFDSGGDNSYHTTDRDWVFRDLPLSTRIEDGTVALTFELISDGGLEMGGWTLDDLCIVADPNAICGDGTINGVEQCDEGGGNADEADACRINCRRARCGDSIIDSTEQCDDGNREDGDACSDICELPDDGGGCCSTGTDPTSALAPLALVVGGLLFRRRRRAGRPIPAS